MSESISGGDMAGARGAGMVTIPAYILEDSPRLAKKLDDLKAAEKRARDAVALVGPAEEIGQLRAQAVAERDEQDRITAQARKQCIETLAAAKAEAASMVSLARETSQDLLLGAEKRVEAAEKIQAEAQRYVADAAGVREELQGKETALDSERARLHRLEDDVVATQQQLLKEKSELASVREQITAVLR